MLTPEMRPPGDLMPDDEILSKLDELKAGQEELRRAMRQGFSDTRHGFSVVSDEIDGVRRELLQAIRESNETILGALKGLDSRVTTLERQAS